MDPSPAVAALLRRFEKKVLTAYPDPASPRGQALLLAPSRRPPNWETLPADPFTIGYGHTGPEVVEGMVIDDAQAEAYLAVDIAIAAAGVNLILGSTPCTQSQFDAFCSFAFNAGIGTPENHDKGLWGSTLMAQFKRGNISGAAYQFTRWVFANGKIMGGLVRRRAAERRLFEGRDLPSV